MLFTLWRDTTSELWTPVHSFYIAITVYPFTCFIYILANYYLLPLDTLNPLFTANRWDWQPHCELGQSTWLCCEQVPRCCWCKAKPWTSHLAPLSGAVAKLAGINLRKFGSFSYWFDKPWFHNWGKACCCAHHNLLLGFPTGRLYIYNSYINTAPPATRLCVSLILGLILSCDVVQLLCW
jgi:hypothetical protein